MKDAPDGSSLGLRSRRLASDWMPLPGGWVLNPAIEQPWFANIGLLVVFLEYRCPRATRNGCTTGRPSSRRWTITAWCVRWTGDWIGPKAGPAAMAVLPDRVRAICWNISRVSTIASFGQATTSILTR